MAKVKTEFPYEIYRFIHKPIRTQDQLDGQQFVERYTFAFQRQFEVAVEKVNKLVELYDPARTPQPRFLKDIVGFTSELDQITNDISDDDLRKLITLAVALWKQKGLEIGYKNIIRLFTGKNSRVFNWFDFRYIVGEQGLAQEELGEDSWFISVPGVGESIPEDIILLLPFEENLFDRSLNPMDAIAHGSHQFFDNGPTTGSNQYLHVFSGGIIEVPNSSKFDFSGNFTIEGFVRATDDRDAVLFRKGDANRSIEIKYNSLTDEIIYSLYDGFITKTETLASGEDLGDGVFRHFALVLDRTQDLIKFFFNGNESTTGIAVGSLLDLTNTGKIWICGTSPSVDLFEGSIDNFRISKRAQYDATLATALPPSVAFIPYQEEQLDEFFSDVRVVDEGDLNRTLTLRILNLMRPISERLRVIYIRFFEDFAFGKGNLASEVLGSFIDTVNEELVLPTNSVEICDSIGNADFIDYVLQTRIKIDIGTEFSVRFLVQDSSNYYEFVMHSDTQEFSLNKVVAGVPTPLAANVPAQIFNETYYVLSVIVDLNDITNEVLLRCYQDRNTIFEVLDTTFTKGTWGVASGAGATCRLSEIEMFLMPLEYDIIEPNQVI